VTEPAANLSQTVERLAQRVEGRYYGKYRGVVTNVQDPTKNGRIKARVPQVFGDLETGWALPCVPYTGQQEGLFALPKVDSGVWIEFEAGDPSYPVWVGGFWANNEVPDAAPPTTKVLKTTAGHKLVFDDEAKSVLLSDANGNSVTLDKNGIKIADKNGNSITLGSSGIVLATGSGTVSVGDGAADNLVAFNALQSALTSFLSMLTAHTHVCAAPGSPSGPPTPPPQLQLTPAKSRHKVQL
jgi:uncharacterized protein involved in type VI secretion and phage assembly